MCPQNIGSYNNLFATFVWVNLCSTFKKGGGNGSGSFKNENETMVYVVISMCIA